MIDDGQATSLGRHFGPQTTANPGKTGVFLLPHGRDAFAARALLARMSEKSLVIQYYMYHQDTVGGLLTFEVLKAADRGVRVRMLIDDIYGNQDEDTWVALDAHENIEVRLWNPWKRGGGRLIPSLVRVAEIDYRMHAKGLQDGSLAFSWSEARVIHDSAQKMDLKSAGTDELLISQLAPYITNAKRTVDIVSPYFVPGDRATDALCTLSRDGVKVRILTNSLASNDVSAVHAGYSKYRRTLLRCGVWLFELDETLKDRESKMFTWLPGLAKSSLHAKSMVFDGEYMFVGSFNFDKRSLHINNEIGLIFRDPEIAGKSAENFEKNVNKVAFKVEFSREGGRENLHWVGGQGGPRTVIEEEPYATTGQKLIVGILKWLPIDSQL